MTGLSADKLAAMLDGCRLARQIIVLEEIGSTSDVVTAAAREGAAEGLTVFAETQTAGRGRLGRKWESAARQGLWFSLLLRPQFSQPLWIRLTTCAAVAVAEAVEQTAPCRVEIKWPNDLQIAGKKVAGILIETGTDRTRAPFAAVGIGVNVNQGAHDFPPQIASIATSLRQTVNHEVDRAILAAAILRRLDECFAKLESHFPEIIASAVARSPFMGRNIQLRAGTELIEGTAQRLDENGALILRKTDGEEYIAASGDLTVAAIG